MGNDRAAWTEHITGKKRHKYGAERQGKYPSKHHEEVARKLWALSKSGAIEDLREEVPFLLVPPKNKCRGVTYIADFTYVHEGQLHVCDAKGYRTQVYKLKRRMMYLLLSITIDEL